MDEQHNGWGAALAAGVVMAIIAAVFMGMYSPGVPRFAEGTVKDLAARGAAARAADDAAAGAPPAVPPPPVQALAALPPVAEPAPKPAPQAAPKPAAKPAAKPVKISKPARAARKPRPAGAGCPCSGRQVCIGPRGGRYCIAPSGRKRYGV